MRILELSLRNYRVFEQVDLELPARVIGIFGANGSGKSTLMEAIQFACYGSGRTSKDHIRTHGVLTECSVRLVFEHGGQQYEVRRAIKGKGHQAEADLLVGGAALAVGAREVDQEIRRLLRMDQQVFRSSVFAEQKQLDAFSDLTRSKRKEMVLRLLGIKPVDDARAAARKAAREQRTDAERLAGALPDLSERQASLEAAVETLAKAVERAEEVRAGLAAAEEALAETDAAFRRAERARLEVEKVAGELEQAERDVVRLIGARGELTTRMAEVEEALAALPGIEEEAERLAGTRELLASARAWTEAAEELRSAERALERLPDVDPDPTLAELEETETALREAEAAAHRAQATAERAAADLAAAEAELDRAGDLDPTQPCPTCGQPLGEAFRDVVTHREGDVRGLRKAAAGATRRVKAAEAARGEAVARHAEARARAEEARGAAQDRSRLEGEVGRLREMATRLAEPFEGEPPDLEDLQARASRSDELARQAALLQGQVGHLDRMREDLGKTEAELAEATERAEALTERRQILAFDPDLHRALRQRFDEAGRAVDQARRDEREASDAAKDAEREVEGLRARLESLRETEAAVGRLRDEARYAQRVALLLDGFRDHLVGRIGPELSREAEALFRDLTNHEYEDLKIDEEDLSIHIADGGSYFPIERFSGSEADLANLALRVAISMHLSRVSGADLGMMVLDEVLASLDAERRDLLVQAMGRLANRFHQVFVITHAEQVKDQFQAVIEVRKTSRRRSEAVLA